MNAYIVLEVRAFRCLHTIKTKYGNWLARRSTQKLSVKVRHFRQNDVNILEQGFFKSKSLKI